MNSSRNFHIIKNWRESSSQNSVNLANLTLGIIWIYHGVFPKILFPHSGEFQFLQKVGAFPGHEVTALFCFGIMEICFGLLFLFWQTKYTHYLNILALIGLAVGTFVFDAFAFVQPFDPFTLNLAMIMLSVIALCHLSKIT